MKNNKHTVGCNFCGWLRAQRIKLILALILFFLIWGLTPKSTVNETSLEYVHSTTVYASKFAEENNSSSENKTYLTISDEEVSTIDNEIGINDDFFSMNVTEYDIETFSVRLPELLPNYKNPCWIEMVPDNFSYRTDSYYYKYYESNARSMPPADWKKTFLEMESVIVARKNKSSNRKAWRIRCFPYFFIPGFTKSGTSDVYKMLITFPDIVAGIKKEPKYWNQERLPPADTSPAARLCDYLDLYDAASEEIRNHVTITKEGLSYHSGIIGDFDPMVIWKMPKWRLIHGNEARTEPLYLTQHHLHSISPNTKIIVLMRNPVDRTYSHYKHFNGKKRKNVQPQQFHEDMIKTINKVNECFSSRSMRECLHRNWGPETNTVKSLIGGIYHVFLEDWLSVFPKEQFLFIKSEDYFHNRTTEVLKILRFLQIDTKETRQHLRDVYSFPVAHQSPPLMMTTETRTLLERFFRPFNAKLKALLNDDKWCWDL